MKKVIIVLVTLATVSATVATFMPMKAILILSSGNVPRFFPDLIATMDPPFIAVLLLAASALFAGVSWITWNGIDKLRTREVLTNASDFSLTSVERARLGGIRKRKGEPGAEILVSVFFGIVLFWISPAFLLLTYTWLLGSLLGIRWTLIRKNRSEPSVALKVEIGGTFRKWIRNSAFPSTLGIALISLLTDQIQFEVTGALVAAILGRRLQISFAALLSQSVNSGRDSGDAPLTASVSEDSQVDSLTFAHVREHPRVENASKVLKYSAKHQEREPENLLILHSRNEKAASVVAAHLHCPSDVYFRVFNTNASSTRDLELKFRSTSSPISLFTGQVSRKINIDKVPCIEVHVDSPVAMGQELEQSDIRRWQIELELSCLHSPEFQNWCSEDPSEFSYKHFDAAMARVMTIPGAHQENAGQLLNQSGVLHQVLLEGPYVWVTDVNLRQSNFLRRIDGNLILLDPFGWRVGRLGDGKTPNTNNPNSVGSIIQSGFSNRDAELASLRRKRNLLFKALLNGSFAEVDILASQLNRLLESLLNNNVTNIGEEARVSEL